MSSPASTATPVRTIVHLSDTHILPDLVDRLHGVDTHQNVRDIVQRLAESNLHVDAVVLSGDLADGGHLASYQRLRPLLDALHTRIIVAIGNHDARPAFCAAMLDADASDAPIEYVTWIEGLRVIVLDSTVPGAPTASDRNNWTGSAPSSRRPLQKERCSSCTIRPFGIPVHCPVS